MYNQKQKYDKKCTDSRLPIETMEQYMYTFLNQRYGLKNLIIEWASAIINGVKKYGKEDSDITLFGKIMRNECDEDFRFVHAEVKTAISDILKEKLRRKYRNKSEDAIISILNKVQGDEIEEWQWKDIISKMYNEEHAAILEERIRKQTTRRNATSPNLMDRRRLTREQYLNLQKQKERSILFNEFQKVTLNLVIDCIRLPIIYT